MALQVGLVQVFWWENGELSAFLCTWALKYDKPCIL